MWDGKTDLLTKNTRGVHEMERKKKLKLRRDGKFEKK